MTIENAKVLQERLADEAIAQVQVQGSKELADACIHSIGIVGNDFRDIQFFRSPTKRQTGRHMRRKNKRGVLATWERERTQQILARDILLQTWQRRPCRPYGNCLRQPLILTMTQTATSCLILRTRWQKYICRLTGLVQSLS